MAQPPIPVQPVNTAMTSGLARVTPPWRQFFDGILQLVNAIPSGGSAPANATYVVASADPTLTAERVATDSTSIDVITATPGQMSWERAALTGDVTASQNSNATTIAADAVTYAKMQNVSAAERVLGRGQGGGAGDVQELTLGTGLSMSGTTISATGTGTGGLQVSTVLLTDAQIKALPTTPITVVTAQGAGFRVKPLGLTYVTRFAGGAYTNINTTYATLQVQVPNGAWVSTVVANDNTLTTPLAQLTALFGATQVLVDIPVPYFEAKDAGNAAGTGEWIQEVVTAGIGDFDNDALQIAIDNNGSGDLTGGNASNTLLVTVYWVKEAV